MGRTLQISYEAYHHLHELAVQQGTSEERVVESLIASALQNGPRHETDDWLRHLGLCDEEIEESKAQAEADADLACMK